MLSIYGWRVLLNFSVAAQPLLNQLVLSPHFQYLVFDLDVQQLYQNQEALKIWLAILKNISKPVGNSKHEYDLDARVAETLKVHGTAKKLC